jgi:ribosomal protein S27E
MQWIACRDCGHESAYTGHKPVGTRIDCPVGCGTVARVTAVETP